MKKRIKLTLKWVVAVIVIGLLIIIAKNWQTFVDGFQSV